MQPFLRFLGKGYATMRSELSLLLLVVASTQSIAQTTSSPSPKNTSVPVASPIGSPISLPNPIIPNLFSLYFVEWAPDIRIGIGTANTRSSDGWDGPYEPFGQNPNGTVDTSVGENGWLVIPAGGTGNIVALTRPSVNFQSSISLDFHSSNDNVVHIQNSHNVVQLFLQAKSSNTIQNANVTASITGGSLNTNSVLKVKVVPYRTYKIALWRVVDKNPAHSSYFTRSSADVAAEMTKIWGQQGAIKFERFSDKTIMMDNVDPNSTERGGAGVEMGTTESDSIINKGYTPGTDDNNGLNPLFETTS